MSDSETTGGAGGEVGDETTGARASAARRAFVVAGWFLMVLAGLGALLRLQTVRPVAGVNYAHVLHAHSHVAFLGWVFNAFFALALRCFVVDVDVRRFWRLFVVLQIAVVGMLLAYPVQGYDAVSIAFSTLHMVCSAVFAWWLWRRNRATPVARSHLRVALVFMVASGLGPLALGPLAALGLRDSPGYLLAIYFYLHCQYNGWFLFFLQALAFQDASQAREMPTRNTADARRALGWLGTGAVLTLALSTLWLHPPVWVYVIAALGGAAQLVGCFYLVRSLRGRGGRFHGPARWLGGLALAGFLLKHLLQAASAWPALEPWVNHRFTVIAFLHLVFLGVVTPLLLAWGLRLGWLRDGLRLRVGLVVFFAGALATEVVLVSAPMGLVCPRLPETLLAAALALFSGAMLIGGGQLKLRPNRRSARCVDGRSLPRATGS